MEIANINSISFSVGTSIQMRFRAYYRQYTRPAGDGAEASWQKALTELDPELHLRWNFLQKHWSIYYDHRGKMSVIRTFGPGQSFWKILYAIRQNGATTSRQLQQAYHRQKYAEQKFIDDRINDAANECAVSVRNSARKKVTTDGVINNKY